MSFDNDKKKYIDFLKKSDYLELDIIHDLVCIPGVISNNGINIYLLDKISNIIKNDLDKEQINEKYIIKCINKENNYNYLDEKRDNVILIKDNNNLFPIFEVVKNIKDKNIKLNKHFKYMNNNTNIVYQIHDYYNMNCNKDIIEKLFSTVNMTCKELK